MTTVNEAMQPLEELHVITPDTQVLDALKLMAGNDVNQLPVVVNFILSPYAYYAPASYLE